jgi:hypothetical protein
VRERVRASYALQELFQIVLLCRLFTLQGLIVKALVSFKKVICLMLDRISELTASPCATAIASLLVLWLHAALSGLVTTFFCDKDRAMPFMNDLTTFTAPFETDVGQTFQLVLVTPQCPLCLCVCRCVCVEGINSRTSSVQRFCTVRDGLRLSVSVSASNTSVFLGCVCVSVRLC